MKLRLNDKRIIFSVLFILGLFFIFFVGWSFNADTGNRTLSIVSNGVTHFRKGLDVSGGTKLVFKISYDKYEQVYEGAELLNVKKMIETIILKNIDNRISGLGVSDYKAYVQSMDNNPYIVVEIGGIADLDQAKEIIGKTVELEFRLPNEVEPTIKDKELRKALAYALRNDIMSNDNMIDTFADARGSENIYYNHWTGVTIGQLPLLYKNNPSLLDKIEIAKISDVISDIYDVLNNNDGSGNMIKTELYGYTFYRVNNIEKVDRKTASVRDVVDIAEQFGYVYENVIEKGESKTVDTYDYIGTDLVYNLGSVAEGDIAYDVKIVQISGNNMLGVDKSDIDTIKARRISIIDDVKSKIESEDSFEGANLFVDGWISEEQMKSIIPNFDKSNTTDIQSYVNLSNDYIVYLRDTKSKEDVLVSKMIVKNVNKDKIEMAMKSKVLYDIESVFVQDRETWKTAKSKDGDILNGAYFKYANTSQSQVGLPVVAINFDDKGTEIFCDITSDNIGNQMAIFVGGKLLTSPVIRSKICGGTAQIDGNFTIDSAKELVDALNNGALPAPLVLMQEEKISPTLGANALNGALIAALVGIMAIFIYIYILYGWKQAVVTLSVLVSFIVILGLFMKLVDYALSLSGIAAVVLSIGMAVDANILIYERKIEEENRGKTQGSAIDTAYDRSRPAIRDGNISTGLIALLLFMLGSNMFKGFGTMLIVTVLLTLLVNVPLTKILLKVLYKK